MKGSNKLTIGLLLIIAGVSVNASVRAACDTAFCQRQLELNAIARYKMLHGEDDPACRRSYYSTDAHGEALAKAATAECNEARARASIGLDSSTEMQERHAAHFGQEGSRRERQRDRAAYIGAMNRQTQALEGIQRNQPSTYDRMRHQNTLESIDRKLRRW